VVARLPESVKIARARLSLDVSLAGVPFPLNLGTNEVAILLSFYYHWFGVATAAANTIYMGIWKKTDTNPPVISTSHTDMIWNLIETLTFVTESLKQSGKEHVILPQPLVLVRAPRLVGFHASFTSATLEMRLFYRIQRVSDEELAKLMVKDHA